MAAMESWSYSLTERHRDHPRTRERWSARELHIGSPFTMRQHVVDGKLEMLCLHHSKMHYRGSRSFWPWEKRPLPIPYLSVSHTASLRSSSDYDSTRSHSLQSWINGHARQLFLLSSRFHEFPPKVLIVAVSHLYELTIFR